jgi:hypothetical protein
MIARCSLEQMSEMPVTGRSPRASLGQKQQVSNRVIGQPFVGLRDPLAQDEAGMPTVVQIAASISTT